MASLNTASPWRPARVGTCARESRPSSRGVDRFAMVRPR
jgi:hypothetical protein